MAIEVRGVNYLSLDAIKQSINSLTPRFSLIYSETKKAVIAFFGVLNQAFNLFW